jgi:hypothetical protein
MLDEELLTPLDGGRPGDQGDEADSVHRWGGQVGHLGDRRREIDVQREVRLDERL